MSGIGNHNFSVPYGEGGYGGHVARAICPFCSFADCEADWVDVGVGEQQCGPFNCPKCGASEIGAYDKPRPGLTAKEIEVGWYTPGTPPSSLANTVKGKLVDHRTALVEYRKGNLDQKDHHEEVDN